MVFEENASDVFAVTAPLDFNSGDQIAMVSQIIPDFIEDGEVDVFLFGQDLPNTNPITYGPYRISYDAPVFGSFQAKGIASGNNPTPTRARGRQITMRVQGATSIWKLGDMRAQVHLGGKK